jgi:hypothetical protein
LQVRVLPGAFFKMKSPALACVILIANLLFPARTLHAQNPLVDQGKFPNLVHAFEDFETPIEKRWWLRGIEETKGLPPSLSTLPNTRAFRSRIPRDIDLQKDDKNTVLNAVMFNPVPGPPMGKNTRLSFRYRLTGSGNLRVQIFSLTKEDNYHANLTNLPQNKWQSATVDMTQLRRNDGSPGHLSEDQRIDDIQFYVDPGTQVIIDDIVLYDAATEDEKEPFPARILFTGWFDTGEQGKEWPGDYRIVPHERPNTWKMAASVINEQTKTPWLRIGLRGQRPLPEKLRLRFKYKLAGAANKPVEIALVDRSTGQSRRASLKDLVANQWGQITVDLNGKEPASADELHILLPAAAQIFIDDLLLYEPAQ